jgi:branched-chain amino acid transport system substrate-binding protein
VGEGSIGIEFVGYSAERRNDEVISCCFSLRLSLLGRPVELVYYDDQSNPTNVPGIYTKLITVDNVDLLLGPYATSMAAAAMPVIMQHNMTTISILAIDVNRHFHYSRYFDMVPVGPEGTKAFSRGFFELAAAQQPKP